MPRQEVFLEKTTGDRHIEVLKTYDQTTAREAFFEMDTAAKQFLWDSLAVDEQDEVPDIDSAEGEDVLWDALLKDSREDGNRLSFFLVTETNGKCENSVPIEGEGAFRLSNMAFSAEGAGAFRLLNIGPQYMWL